MSNHEPTERAHTARRVLPCRPTAAAMAADDLRPGDVLIGDPACPERHGRDGAAIVDVHHEEDGWLTIMLDTGSIAEVQETATVFATRRDERAGR